MEEEQFSQQSMREQLDIYMQKMNLGTDFTTFTKIYTKCIIT